MRNILPNLTETVITKRKPGMYTFNCVFTVFRACSVCLCGFTAHKQSPESMTHQSRVVRLPGHGD